MGGVAPTFRWTRPGGVTTDIFRLNTLAKRVLEIGGAFSTGLDVFRLVRTKPVAFLEPVPVRKRDLVVVAPNAANIFLENFYPSSACNVRYPYTLSKPR